MKTEFMESYLLDSFDDCSDYAYMTGEYDIEPFKNKFENYLNNLENLDQVLTNRRTIDNSKFINILDFFCYITLNYQDFLNILFDMYGLEYTFPKIIKTKMRIKDVLKTEGRGRDFSWWKEDVGINYEILPAKDVKINQEHYYSKEEIEKMIDSKHIILLRKLERECPYANECDGYEEYFPFKTFYNGYEYYDISYVKNLNRFITETSSEFKLATYRYIRRYMSSKKILEGMKFCLENFCYDVDEINKKTEWTDVSDESYVTMAKMCKAIFEQPNNKEKLNILKKKYIEE